jgi:hypothetical protein
MNGQKGRLEMQAKRIVVSYFICVGMFLLNASESSAEIIILKSGRRVEGKVVNKSQYYIDVAQQGTVETIFDDDIAKIEDSVPAVPAAAVPDAVVPDAAAPAAQKPVLPDISPSDPDYQQIFNICKNFFSHVLDHDIHAWSGDATAEFRAWTLSEKPDRDAKTKRENPLVYTSTVKNLTVVSLKGNGNAASAVFLVLRGLNNGRTVTYKMSVGLLKEGGKWKISEMHDTTGK